MVSRGNWPQLRQITYTTAQSSVAEYVVTSSQPVKNIEEIVFDDEVAEMLVDDLLYVEQRNRSAGYGPPRFYAISETNASAKPVFKVSPPPGAAQAGKLFEVKTYIAPPLYTAADANVVVPLPSRPLVQGLVASLILNENIGGPSQQYQTEFAFYERFVQEAINRYTADTGSDINMIPSYSGRN